MATRTPVVNQNIENRRVTTISWSGLLNGDDGSPIDWVEYSDRSIQFNGTFGAAGSIQLEGSNDGTNWFVLNDLQGSTIVKTAAALEGVAEFARYVRPKVTAGDGTTNLVATLAMRGTP